MKLQRVAFISQKLVWLCPNVKTCLYTHQPAPRWPHFDVGSVAATAHCRLALTRSDNGTFTIPFLLLN